MKKLFLWEVRILQLITLIILFLPTISLSAPNLKFLLWYDNNPPEKIKEGDLGIVSCDNYRSDFSTIYQYHFGCIRKNKGTWMCRIKDPTGMQQEDLYLIPVASLPINPEVIRIISGQSPSGRSEIRGSDILAVQDFLTGDEYFKHDSAQFRFKMVVNGDASKLICVLENNAEFTIFPVSDNQQNPYDQLARKNPTKVISLNNTDLYSIGCGWVKKGGKTVEGKRLPRKFSISTVCGQLDHAINALKEKNLFKGSGYIAIDGKHYAGGDQLDMDDKDEGKNRVFRILPPEWNNP